jgi:hypothetical protein
MRPGCRFGYDVAVFEDPNKAGSTNGRGSLFWDGAAGAWFWIDPTNETTSCPEAALDSASGGGVSVLCAALAQQQEGVPGPF